MFVLRLFSFARAGPRSNATSAMRIAEARPLQFFHQNTERGRDTGVFDRFSFNYGLVSLVSPLNIIRFQVEHFLQSIGCTIGLKCPDFHFAKALATKLGFTTQRLLAN